MPRNILNLPSCVIYSIEEGEHDLRGEKGSPISSAVSRGKVRLWRFFPSRFYLTGSQQPRGNVRQTIFLDDADRQTFIDNLGWVCGPFQLRVWVWRLMGSNYHLLIETRKPTLPKGMHEVDGIYSSVT